MKWVERLFFVGIACGTILIILTKIDSYTISSLNEPVIVLEELGTDDYSAIEDFMNDSNDDNEWFQTILKGSGEFVDSDTGDNMTLQRLADDRLESDNIHYIQYPWFATVDLDGDREKELIVWEKINGLNCSGYNVFKRANDNVQRYYLNYREMISLKEDGTFIYSNGAYDFGIGRLSFTNNTVGVDKLIWKWKDCTNPENKTYHYKAGEEIGEHMFNYLVDLQNAKKDISWNALE